MARNKIQTRKLREEAKKLKARLYLLTAKLEQYVHFGGHKSPVANTTSASTADDTTSMSSSSVKPFSITSNNAGRAAAGSSTTDATAPKRIPLADVLRLTLEFAMTPSTRSKAASSFTNSVGGVVSAVNDDSGLVEMSAVDGASVSSSDNHDCEGAASSNDAGRSGNDAALSSPSARGGNSSPEDVQMENLEGDRGNPVGSVGGGGIADVAMMSPAQLNQEENSAGTTTGADALDGNQEFLPVKDRLDYVLVLIWPFLAFIAPHL